MTPTRVALMMGGCWVIPTFISFLPIMQGWNSIGIDHVVSRHDRDGHASDWGAKGQVGMLLAPRLPSLSATHTHTHTHTHTQVSSLSGSH